MKFSVIIPSHNAARTLPACLDALQRQTTPANEYEIIVVDDASTDETAVTAQQAGVKTLHHAVKKGAGAARNTAVRQAQGEIICFTDADCIPIPAWIEILTAPLLANPEIAAVKGAYATRQQEIVARFVQIEYEDKYDRLKSQRRIDFVDTHSAAFRRDVLLANDGFDEKIHYAEDRELAYRLAARGYQMVFQPEAVVAHWHTAAWRGYFRKKFFIGYWVMQTLRRFPGQSVSDSHTPQVMKLQILLMGGLLAGTAVALPTAFFISWQFLWLPLAILIVFFLTTLPFAAKAWPKDKAVALASPFLLATRALALGLGYALGVARPLTGMAGAENTLGGLDYLEKRLMDAGLAGLGLLLCLLLSPILLPLVWLGGRRPCLQKTEMIGQGGRPFTCIQFQTDDQRPTGRFLRRWRLQKLPLLWAVLRGDLSLIGPQAEDAAAVARYDDQRRRRLAVKPGLISPILPGKQLLDERTPQELAYIDNYSLWRDGVILGRAILALFRGQR